MFPNLSISKIRKIINPMLTLMVITLIWRKRREILPLLQKFLPFIPAPAMVRVQTKVLPAAFPRVKK